MGGRLEETEIELRTPCSDTILNYRLSQKFKLLGCGKFNHLNAYFLTDTIQFQRYFKPVSISCALLIL